MITKTILTLISFDWCIEVSLKVKIMNLARIEMFY